MRHFPPADAGPEPPPDIPLRRCQVRAMLDLGADPDRVHRIPMGIDVDRTIVTTFAVGGAMAGVAGILWGILFGSVTEFTGFLPGIKAFSAAVVGGIGNLGGAMAGGLTLGGSESLAPQLILEPLGVTGHTQLKDAVAFLVLIYVLLVKPTGLFGERLSAEDRA